jgi:CheY-like chemotaxis protein
MVHGFVQQSHGVLEIESEAGKGTIVRMIFPALVANGARGGSVAGQGARDEGAPPAPTILVVDDNSDVLELAEVTLEANGYCVVTADSAERAIERLAADKSIALVFSDIIMPGGMSGIELAGVVKDKYAEIPVVLTTGYTEELTGNSAAQQLDILPKPYSNADLAKRISDALQRSAKNAAKA